MRFVLDPLDGSTIERAGALIAREHEAARQGCPQLPDTGAQACTEALQHLLDAGGRGIVAGSPQRTLAVMTARVRVVPAVGQYARLPPEGLAVDPDLSDPTTILAEVYATLAAPLVADGVSLYYLLHVARSPLSASLANLGFGRNGVYAVQAATPRPAGSDVAVRVAGPDDLETVARLSLVEVQHRATAPMFGPADHRTAADLLAEHRTLHQEGAVHLLAMLDGRDVGLLTLEPTTPVPRLCPAGQPYIGPTATLPEARRRGVGQALVNAALDWAHRNGYKWLSVDFESANPLSRPFWLGSGFHPTGYGLLRYIDPRHDSRTVGP